MVAKVDTFSYQWAKEIFSSRTSASCPTPAIRIGQSGEYVLTVTDTVTGCFDTRLVNATFAPFPVVALGNDTVVCGDSLSVKIDRVVNESYSWLAISGSFTQAGDTGIVVRSSGSFEVTATNTAGNCQTRDTINVIIDTLSTTNLITPDSLTVLDSIIIRVSIPLSDTITTWNGTLVQDSIIADTTGWYYVSVVRKSTGCIQTDSVFVTIDSCIVDVALGNDTTLCGDSLLVTVPFINNNISYSWNGSPATTDTFFVARNSGQVIVIGTDAVSGCQETDTINIILNPLPVVALGNDTILCGDSLDIIVADFDTLDYDWSAAAGSPAFVQLSDTSIRVASGTYSLTVTDITNWLHRHCPTASPSASTRCLW